MSDVTQNLRPGVYSRYQVSGGYTATARRDCALVLPGLAEFTAIITSRSPVEQLPELAQACLKLLLEGGVGRIYLACGETAESALSLLGEGDPGAIICDCQTLEDYAALKEYVLTASAAMRECIGFCAASPADASNLAAQLCCERMMLCAPAVSIALGEANPLYGACCLAAQVLAASGPTVRLAGCTFPQLTAAEALSEPVIQGLLAAGVCVFEAVGGQVELIRAMTTRTRSNGGENDGLRSLNTVLIMDDVVRHIRQCLKARLGGLGISSLGSVRDQVAVELAAKREQGVIADFAPPLVRPSDGDPTVCQVELAFSVAHLVSVIHITAQIRV